jgi:hypothetical protein
MARREAAAQNALPRMSKVPFAFIIVRKGFAPALSGPADGGMVLPTVIQNRIQGICKVPPRLFDPVAGRALAHAQAACASRVFG